MIYLLITDTIAYLLSVLFAAIFWAEPSLAGIEVNHWILIIGGWGFFILTLYGFGGYRSYLEFSRLREVTSLIKTSILTLAVISTVVFLFKIQLPEFLAVNAQIAFGLGLVLIPIISRRLVHSVYPEKKKREKILIFGAGEIGQAYISLINPSMHQHFNILGFIDDRNSGISEIRGYPILGGSKDLVAICKDEGVDRIFVAIRHLSDEILSFLSTQARELGFKLNFIPSLESFQANPSKLKTYYGIPWISANTINRSILYQSGKRLIDLVIATIAFILTSPLWLVIPILIKKDSPGPVFFKQKRVGQNGKEFTMYKFRSLYRDSPEYAHCPTDSFDPRISKVGKWLRKISLDELPQLINVMRGEMSIVGPRPEMPFIVDNYNWIEEKRLLVKPGITGLWQVSPYRNSEICHNLELDFYYIQNQGFVLDFIIIIMTLLFVIRGITH